MKTPPHPEDVAEDLRARLAPLSTHTLAPPESANGRSEGQGDRQHPEDHRSSQRAERPDARGRAIGLVAALLFVAGAPRAVAVETFITGNQLWESCNPTETDACRAYVAGIS